jgi:PAS domain S-box-containing protein
MLSPASDELNMRLRDLLHRAPTIRQWLAMLLAAVILPASVAVIVLFVYSYRHERTAIELATLDVSRALNQAIDRELASARAAMQALATSHALDQGDLRGFYQQATDVLHYRPGNFLLLSDRNLRQVVNTHLPFGAPLPLHGNPAQLRKVMDSGQPAVSDLYIGPTVGRLLTSVDVPVWRNGRVKFVLSMQYFGERLGEILNRQNIPADSFASILDSGGRLVWRNRASRGHIGEPASPALTAALAHHSEGIVDENDPDGHPSVTVFSRSPVSNWTVAIARHRGAMTAALWRSLAWIGFGGLALLALGLALVRSIGGRIERSVRGLVAPAIALGYGQPVTLPPLHLREARDVGHALVQAAALMRERTVQRDAAEQAERALRDANRAIEQSEAFLRGIFEEAPDAVFLIGEDCRVVRVNAQAEQLFGYAQGQLVGQPIDELLYEAGPQPRSVCQQLQAAPLRRGLDGVTQLHGRRPDGSAFPVDAMASPLRGRAPALVILTVRDITSAWQNETALRSALDDKNILLKELYHRVKNNLQLVNSLFNLQVRALPEGAGRVALLEAAGRVRAMALVHERLYQSRTLSSIALDDYLGELCDQLARAASAAQRGIAMRVEAEPIEIGLDAAVPLGLLLNELVSNSLKHAFPEGRHGTIAVRIVRGEEDMVHVTVSDDGIGLPEGLDQTSSQTLGLKLIAALSDQLRGKFSLINRGGAHASLLFRLAKPRLAPVDARKE